MECDTLGPGLEVGTGAVEENIAILDGPCMTYGDGVSNVDIAKLIDFHKKGSFGNGHWHPLSKFGVLSAQMIW